MATKAEAAAVAKRREAAEKHPDSWIAAEAGDRLEGTVIDVDTAWSDQRAEKGDGFYPLLTIETADGVTLKWHAFETVAYNEVVKRQPVPGERIVVTYLGEGEAKVRGRNAPKLFRVTVPGRDPKTVAERVYGQLRPQGGARGQQAAEPDAPADTSDLPF